jgi:hypothetical protein
MADQEIIKHTKKVYKIWNSKEHTFIEKLKEFLFEIFIIVFAVSLSIWLHSSSEHRHQQKEVKEFLISLKQQLKSDSASIVSIKNGYTKIIQQSKNKNDTPKDSIYLNVPISPIDDGIYQGFKSSGKLGYIENKEIKASILTYYEKLLPLLNKFDEKLEDKLKILNHENNYDYLYVPKLLNDPKKNVRNLTKKCIKNIEVSIILENATLDDLKNLNKLIKEELVENFDYNEKKETTKIEKILN